MLKLAALLVYLQYFRYNTATVKSFDSQSADHIFRISLYLLQCQHCCWVFESYPYQVFGYAGCFSGPVMKAVSAFPVP